MATSAIAATMDNATLPAIARRRSGEKLIPTCAGRLISSPAARFNHLEGEKEKQCREAQVEDKVAHVHDPARKLPHLLDERERAQHIRSPVGLAGHGRCCEAKQEEAYPEGEGDDRRD